MDCSRCRDGKHYNYFRDYDAVIGRYLESDPIGLLGGRNTFGYGANSPFIFVDPMGLCEEAIFRGGYIVGWKPCYPPPPPPQPPRPNPGKQCKSCEISNDKDYDYNIRDVDLSDVKVPRNPTALCTTNCVAKAMGKLVGKELLMLCVVEPIVAWKVGHAFAALAATGSMGYGSYSAASDILECPASCENRLNPPLAGGNSYK